MPRFQYVIAGLVGAILTNAVIWVFWAFARWVKHGTISKEIISPSTSRVTMDNIIVDQSRELTDQSDLSDIQGKVYLSHPDSVPVYPPSVPISPEIEQGSRLALLFAREKYVTAKIGELEILRLQITTHSDWLLSYYRGDNPGGEGMLSVRTFSYHNGFLPNVFNRCNMLSLLYFGAKFEPRGIEIYKESPAKSVPGDGAISNEEQREKYRKAHYTRESAMDLIQAMRMEMDIDNQNIQREITELSKSIFEFSLAHEAVRYEPQSRPALAGRMPPRIPPG